MLWRKLVPVFALGALAVGYILVRPSLAANNPYLVIIEFPVALLLVGTLLVAALRPERREAPPPVWRKHAQVVRTLADPVVQPDASLLAEWVATGEHGQEAADVLARAATNDAAERERLQAEIEPALADARSRRKREALLTERLRQPGTGV